MTKLKILFKNNVKSVVLISVEIFLKEKKGEWIGKELPTVKSAEVKDLLEKI